MATITLLPNTHVSPETAYVVDDYPYGYTLRCSKRYWLEVHPKRGTRLMSQTTNPKKGHVWNKPNASTYCRFAGAMYLDEFGHVQWSGLTEYTNGDEATAWKNRYGPAVPEACFEIMCRWVKAKQAYDARPADEPMAVKAAYARVAFSQKLEA